MIVSNLPEAKSGSFLQRRSVMPGGGGKCNGANVEGRVEMAQMALCLQCYVYIYIYYIHVYIGGQGDILERFHLGMAGI